MKGQAPNNALGLPSWLVLWRAAGALLLPSSSGSTRVLGAMTKHSELAGIAHNIAHHAGSGLSYLSPHLAQALRAVGAETTQIDLLSNEPYPSNAAELKPLRTALGALRSMVQALLERHGFSAADVSAITLEATPAPWDKNGYLLHTRAVVTSSTGRKFDSGWLNGA